ncbi:hypothetical protein [Streptacidiphilus albus]|uniref:hypothetical protein n=1 Tax=Streptacidiphilus albus TaxID=105425 RepID=UPI00068C6F18|nr:hypothetical protein [Streptacidiphilus albus]
MSIDPRDWYAEAGDEHAWVRPVPGDCPNCGCCTARLCETGGKSPLGCAGHSTLAEKPAVSNCPCSAETTPGTFAHRLAQGRAENGGA